MRTSRSAELWGRVRYLAQATGHVTTQHPFPAALDAIHGLSGCWPSWLNGSGTLSTALMRLRDTEGTLTYSGRGRLARWWLGRGSSGATQLISGWAMDDENGIDAGTPPNRVCR